MTDLSLLLGVSNSTVRHAVQSWEEAHGHLLPTRSTIHDLGTTISHKRQIVGLHLQGYFTSEIARATNHDPKMWTGTSGALKGSTTWLRIGHTSTGSASS